MENITALGIIALIIILTDRWFVRIYRKFIEHLERSELSRQENTLQLMKCAEELSIIKDIFLESSKDDLPKNDTTL